MVSPSTQKLIRSESITSTILRGRVIYSLCWAFLSILSTVFEVCRLAYLVLEGLREVYCVAFSCAIKFRTLCSFSCELIYTEPRISDTKRSTAFILIRLTFGKNRLSRIFPGFSNGLTKNQNKNERPKRYTPTPSRHSVKRKSRMIY